MKLVDVGVRYLSRKGMEVEALKGVSFHLPKGTNLGVVGRNGAGKSTLLKVLAGILRPDSGSIDMEGCSVSLLSLQTGFDPNLNAYHNMMLSGLLLGLTKDQIKHKTESIAELSGLADALRRPIHTYSSGMRSRLGFAIAVQADPDVLLIDEVLAVGDQEFRNVSEHILLEKFASSKSVVFVSHQLATIRRLCSRTIWIDRGSVKRDGETNVVLKEYVDNQC